MSHVSSKSRIPVKIRYAKNMRHSEKFDTIMGRNVAVQSEVQSVCSDSVQTSLPSINNDDHIFTFEDRQQEIISDPIHSEFLYYCAMLKEIAPQLTNESDRHRIILWIKKLFRPEYQGSRFRHKRNRYFLMMCISVLNDETYSILGKYPPHGALPDLACVPLLEMPEPAWQKDDSWNLLLDKTLLSMEYTGCSVHKKKHCVSDNSLDRILDEEFRYILFLVLPYTKLVTKMRDRNKFLSWLEALCEIRTNATCSTMKGIRNDYIMALYGYIQELRLAGPFSDYPDMSKPLLPLFELAKLSLRQGQCCIDVTSSDVNDFMSSQPIPEEGAFCYIGVTGEPQFQDMNTFSAANAI